MCWNQVRGSRPLFPHSHTTMPECYATQREVSHSLHTTGALDVHDGSESAAAGAIQQVLIPESARTWCTDQRAGVHGQGLEPRAPRRQAKRSAVPSHAVGSGGGTRVPALRRPAPQSRLRVWKLQKKRGGPLGGSPRLQYRNHYDITKKWCSK